MTEEQVTKAILKWLIARDWKIVCYDFPQSGTGRFLHPNGTTHKTKDSVNPDIVAVKGNICLFFENKDHFYFPDYEKQNDLIVHDRYSDAISELLRAYPVEQIFYGIGYPSDQFKGKAAEQKTLVDFIVGVAPDGTPDFLYRKHGIQI